MTPSKRNGSTAEVDSANDPLAVLAVRYLPRRDSIELTFVSGGTVTVPRRLLREFEGLPEDAPKRLVVSTTADAVTSPLLDIQIDVSSLVSLVLGSRRLSAAFARRGGQRRSRVKAAAARANGAKGGRPRNRRGR